MYVSRPTGVSARAPGSGRPGGRRQVALMVLAAIYGIHYSRVVRITGHYLARFSCTPAGCRILSRAMAGETVNKPNGPGREFATVATPIGWKRSLVFPRTWLGARGWRLPGWPAPGPVAAAPAPLPPGGPGYLFSSRRRPRQPGRGPRRGAPSARTGNLVTNRYTPDDGSYRKGCGKAWRARPGPPITKPSRRDHAAELGRKKSVISCLRLSV